MSRQMEMAGAYLLSTCISVATQAAHDRNCHNVNIPNNTVCTTAAIKSLLIKVKGHGEGKLWQNSCTGAVRAFASGFTENEALLTAQAQLLSQQEPVHVQATRWAFC